MASFTSDVYRKMVIQTPLKGGLKWIQKVVEHLVHILMDII